MGNRIENLGDYNTMRIMLQEHGGKLSAVIKDIKLKVAPKYVGVGILVGVTAGVFGTLITSKISAHRKNRKMLRDQELEEKLKDALIAEGLIEGDASEEPAEQEESPCS